MLLENKKCSRDGGSQGIGAASPWIWPGRAPTYASLTAARSRGPRLRAADPFHGPQGPGALCSATSPLLKTPNAWYKRRQGIRQPPRSGQQRRDELGRGQLEMSEEQWDRVLEVNLKGYFNFTRHTAPSQGPEVRSDHQHHLHQRLARQIRTNDYSASKNRIIGLHQGGWPRSWAPSA